MILDSSAILAIVRREPGFEELIDKLAAARSIRVGTGTLVETGIVIQARMNLDARALLERFLVDLGIATIEFEQAHWRVAVDAYRRYGKGRHPAGLNFGDCLTYATARLAGEPLLVIGDDFSKTDLEKA